MSLELFWAKTKPGSGGCVEWHGAKLPNGYGRLGRMVNGRLEYWLAHRYVWTKTHGEIPAGLLVCHRCDNRRCVNPEHLFLGTHKDNTQDSIRKGRYVGFDDPRTYPHWRPGKPNLGKGKIKLADVPEIRRLKATGLTQKQIGERYGVSAGRISHILCGRNMPCV